MRAACFSGSGSSLAKAKVLIEQWHREYNQVRPHSSLGYKPTAQETVLSITTR